MRALDGVGRLNDAENLGVAFRDFLENRELETPIANHEIGRILLQKRKLDEAESLFQVSMALKRQVFGPDADHIELSYSLREIVTVAFQKDDLVESEKHIHQSLAMLYRLHGEHLDRIEITHILWQRGYLADEMFRKSLTMEKRLFGEKHMYVAVTLGHIANLALAGDYSVKMVTIDSLQIAS